MLRPRKTCTGRPGACYARVTKVGTSHSSCECAGCKGIVIGEAAAAPKRAPWLDRPSARAVRALLFFLCWELYASTKEDMHRAAAAASCQSC